MKCKAIYTGKKPAKEKERTAKDGTVIPAFEGTRYTFLVNDWGGKTGDVLEELFGRTYTDKRDFEDLIEEIEAGAIKLGDLVTVDIRKADFNVNFYCRLDLDSDNITPKQGELPF